MLTQRLLPLIAFGLFLTRSRLLSHLLAIFELSLPIVQAPIQVPQIILHVLDRSFFVIDLLVQDIVPLVRLLHDLFHFLLHRVLRQRRFCFGLVFLAYQLLLLGSHFNELALQVHKVLNRLQLGLLSLLGFIKLPLELLNDMLLTI